jgi:hypothetical protein
MLDLSLRQNLTAVLGVSHVTNRGLLNAVLRNFILDKVSEFVTARFLEIQVFRKVSLS